MKTALPRTPSQLTADSRQMNGFESWRTGSAIGGLPTRLELLFRGDELAWPGGGGSCELSAVGWVEGWA